MTHRFGHVLRFAWLTTVSFLFMGTAAAASLEKIEVTSRLGEVLYAEVPLTLDADEMISGVIVEIAAADDYKIFEVYRDAELDSIRADIVSDARGSRVKLSSRISIKAPFLNLILKVRYGRVSHFKKYAIFLEPAKTVQVAADKKPLPVQKVGENESVQEQAPAVEAVASESSESDSWARTDRYGPIVHGDSLSVIAERLSKDNRYTASQVMVALFEKNRDKFINDNLNMLKSGSFLEVPKAAEVERLNSNEAYRQFADHVKRWKDEPRYSVELEAQKARYSKRVRMGQDADGTASASTPAPSLPPLSEKAANDEPLIEPVKMVEEPGHSATGSETGDADQQPLLTTPAETAEPVQSEATVDSETRNMLAELQKQNELLLQKLSESEEGMNALNRKVDEVTSAASQARIEKLEILLARMQKDLETARQQQQAPQQDGLNWITGLLGLLIIVLLIVVALLMRREPVHPAEVAQPVEPEAITPDETPEIEQAEPQVVEAAVDSAEVSETADVFDSISNFADELTDTDTAEMTPFDAASLGEPDPNVDYLSEADVYIRYGMDEEALQQLEMALKLQPDNTQAHIKKAELLHGNGDKAAFNATLIAANSALAGAELAQFESTVKGLTGIEQVNVEVEESQPEQPLVDMPLPDQDDVDEDEDGDDAFSFDLSNTDTVELEEARQFETRELGDLGEMDWLHGDDVVETDDVSIASDDIGSDTIAITADHGETQVLSDAIDQFEIVHHDSEIQAGDDEPLLDLESLTAAQELDNLLGEFNDEPEGELELPEISPADDTTDDQSETSALEADLSATQYLDNLLGEFSFDDEEESDALDVATDSVPSAPLELGQPTAPVSPNQKLDEDDAVFGATQHLDFLMGEFITDEEEEGTDSLAPDIEHTDNLPELELPEAEVSQTSELTTDADDELDGLLSVPVPEAETVETLNLQPEDTVLPDEADLEFEMEGLDHLLHEFTDDEQEVAQLEVEKEEVTAEPVLKEEPVLVQPVDSILPDEADLEFEMEGLDHLLHEFSDDEQSDTTVVNSFTETSEDLPLVIEDEPLLDTAEDEVAVEEKDDSANGMNELDNLLTGFSDQQSEETAEIEPEAVDETTDGMGELGNLLTGFSDQPSEEIAEIEPETVDEATDGMGELGNLLTGFSDQPSEEIAEIEPEAVDEATDGMDELGNLLSGFSDQPSEEIAEIESEVVDEATDGMGELGNLLSGFSDQSSEEIELDAAAEVDPAVIDEVAEELIELDNPLSAFSEVDDESSVELDPVTSEELLATDEVELDVIDMQLAEFVEEPAVEELSLADDLQAPDKEAVALQDDTTDELDSLLNDLSLDDDDDGIFADLDDAFGTVDYVAATTESSGGIDLAMDQDASQELDELLSEFVDNLDDKDSEASKS